MCENSTKNYIYDLALNILYYNNLHMASCRIKLIFPCPGNVCKKDGNIQWMHAICKTNIFVDSKGILSCDYCDYNFPICDAKFDCQDTQTHTAGYIKYGKASFLAALSEFETSLKVSVKDAVKRQTFMAEFLLNIMKMTFGLNDKPQQEESQQSEVSNNEDEGQEEDYNNEQNEQEDEEDYTGTAIQSFKNTLYSNQTFTFKFYF